MTVKSDPSQIRASRDRTLYFQKVFKTTSRNFAPSSQTFRSRLWCSRTFPLLCGEAHAKTGVCECKWRFSLLRRVSEILPRKKGSIDRQVTLNVPNSLAWIRIKAYNRECVILAVFQNTASFVTFVKLCRVKVTN